MLQPMRGRLASVRATPSRAEDARTVVRVMLEFHDVPVDGLIELLHEQVGVVIARAAPAATPLEVAIATAPETVTLPAAAIATAPETNGTSSDSVTLPAAGRRRRGTQAHPTEGEQD